MTLNLGQMPSLTTELAAFKHLKIIVSSSSSAVFFRSFFILADNRNWHNVLSVWIYSWSLFQVKSDLPLNIVNYGVSKVRKRAKIRNRYNQAPHQTQETNGKVTASQLDITNERQEVMLAPRWAIVAHGLLVCSLHISLTSAVPIRIFDTYTTLNFI